MWEQNESPDEQNENTWEQNETQPEQNGYQLTIMHNCVGIVIRW